MMYEIYTLLEYLAKSENTVQMHFKNSVKSTNLIVLLKAVKEVKSTMSTGKQFHKSTTRFTKNAATTFVLLLCLYSLYI